jgi:hypothetical protein
MRKCGPNNTGQRAGIPSAGGQAEEPRAGLERGGDQREGVGLGAEQGEPGGGNLGRGHGTPVPDRDDGAATVALCHGAILPCDICECGPRVLRI